MSDQGGGNPFDHRNQAPREPGIPVNFHPDQTGVFADPSAYEAALTAHVDQTVGPHSDLFHEALGLDLHLDVLMVPPDRNRPWYTLVTCGMGFYEMKVPPEEGRHKSRMELAVCLPPDWEPFHTYNTPFSGSAAPRWTSSCARVMKPSWKNWMKTRSTNCWIWAAPVFAGAAFWADWGFSKLYRAT